jgi:ATP-dependent RNA helicase DeaD
VRHLHASLQERGFTSVALSGELTQNERTRAVQAIRDGQARVCVATDVAARGLDLPDLGLVIHADLPTNKQTLLHRSGRTGRAGRKGTCVLLVPANRARAAETLISAAGVSAQWSGAPLPEEIRARDAARLLQDPILTDEISEDDQDLARTLLEGRSAEQIAAALVRMYRARLPAPEELTELAPLPGGPRRETASRDGTPREPTLRPEKAAIATGPMVWFSVNIGRAQKADPKWLLPLICRMGGVEKRDVGAIRIQDTETRFEITESMAEDFAANLPDDADDNVRVERSSPPSAAPRRDASAPKRFVKPAYKKARAK